jgi:hypothetical protein
MTIIVTFEKSRRLSTREPLVYMTRYPGEWMLFLPWFTITLHWGGWWPQPCGPTTPEQAERKPIAG